MFRATWVETCSFNKHQNSDVLTVKINIDVIPSYNMIFKSKNINFYLEVIPLPWRRRQHCPPNVTFSTSRSHSMSKPKWPPTDTLILKISCPRPRTSNYTEPASTTVAALNPYPQYSYKISSSVLLSSQFIWTLFCLINIRHKNPKSL